MNVVGAVAIGCLTNGKGRARRMGINELTVGKLTIREQAGESQS